MKLKLRKMASNFALYLFFAFILINLPQAIYGSAEFERRAIFSSLGVDRVEEGYEVSGIVIIQSTPDSTSSNAQLVSASGRDFSEALYRLSVELGKEIGFAHCDTFIVSDSLKDEDVAKVLDFSVRGSKLTQNSKIITCKGSAKEVLQVNMDKKDEIGISLARSITNSSDYLSISDIDLQEFFNLYYSKSGICWTTVVEVKDDSESKGGKEESGESGGQEGNKKKIASEGQVAVYKKGKLQYIVEGDMANIINIINPYTKMGYIHLEDIDDGEKHIEQISLQIIEKSTTRKYYFDGDTACCDVGVKLYLNVLSLKTDSIDVNEISETKTHISDNVKRAIVEYMTKNFDEYSDVCREYKVDFFNLTNQLYRLKNKKFKEIVTSDDEQNGYIENSRYNLKVEIKSKL